MSSAYMTTKDGIRYLTSDQMTKQTTTYKENVLNEFGRIVRIGEHYQDVVTTRTLNSPTTMEERNMRDQIRFLAATLEYDDEIIDFDRSNPLGDSFVVSVSHTEYGNRTNDQGESAVLWSHTNTTNYQWLASAYVHYDADRGRGENVLKTDEKVQQVETRIEYTLNEDLKKTGIVTTDDATYTRKTTTQYFESDTVVDAEVFRLSAHGNAIVSGGSVSSGERFISAYTEDLGSDRHYEIFNGNEVLKYSTENGYEQSLKVVYTSPLGPVEAMPGHTIPGYSIEHNFTKVSTIRRAAQESTLRGVLFVDSDHYIDLVTGLIKREHERTQRWSFNSNRVDILETGRREDLTSITDIERADQYLYTYTNTNTQKSSIYGNLVADIITENTYSYGDRTYTEEGTPHEGFNPSTFTISSKTTDMAHDNYGRVIGWDDYNHY
ncbi:hypothetical protein BVX93_02190 [bacterium B13(2017)]|nr:hypothetical protein BVX93_02190 [bacterium B13(2017)]